jgi:tetratricopeptide (TPR) repeat protein
LQQALGAARVFRLLIARRDVAVLAFAVASAALAGSSFISAPLLNPFSMTTGADALPTCSNLDGPRMDIYKLRPYGCSACSVRCGALVQALRQVAGRVESVPDALIEEYRKAVHLGPRFADLRTKLAVALREKGDFDAALVEFQEALKVNAKYVPAYLHLGVT